MNQDSKGIVSHVFGSSEWFTLAKEKLGGVQIEYSKLLEATWQGPYLSPKDKWLILVGIFLAQGRREELSRVLANVRQQGMVSPEELVEVVATVFISRGPLVLHEAFHQGILSHDQILNFSVDADGPQLNKAQILEYFLTNIGNIPNWIDELSKTVPDGLELYYSWRNRTLSNGILPRKIKELVLVAVNAAGLYKEGIRIHSFGCLQAGGNENELREALLVAFVSSGVVAWIEGIRTLDEFGILRD